MKLSRKSIKGKLLNNLLKFMSLRINGGFIGKGSSLGASHLELDYGTRINGKIVIKGAGAVSIGKYCAIGDNVRIISSNHEIRTLSIQLALQKRIAGNANLMENKHGVEIGNDVWVGDSVIILPGISIGNGAVIGAGSVVTRDVDTYAVVAGNPAKTIKKRFSEEISDALNDLCWWNWSEQEMRSSSFLFGNLMETTDKALMLIKQAEIKK